MGIKHNFYRKATAAIIASTMIFSAVISFDSASNEVVAITMDTASSTESMEWGSVQISGGGFVSGIVTGDKAMYARTDVGGAYKYNYETNEWDQMMNFVSEEDRGFLSVDAITIDPTDDNTIYMLCGCAYFSGARTAIFKSTDGGESFTKVDVTDMIQVHGNGYGRQCGESIAVDPDNTNTIYCGGDTTGLIVSYDAGKTWGLVDSYNSLGLFTYTIKWPTWTDHMVSTTAEEYSSSNGVGTIAVTDGKVYVGASVKGVTNMYVADVGKDNWTEMSSSLPTDVYPSRINVDANGDLLISYVPTLTFGSSGGGAYKYDVETGTVTNISPKANAPFGAVVSAKDDANTLVATTCGLWYSQLWDANAWDTDTVAWGDITFKSTDGGKTWTQMAPGNAISWGKALQANYLQDGGISWIHNKAIHWTGAVVIDPQDENRILMTSGNGVFACDDVWSDIPTFHFQAKGIEEVVALDMVSVPGGNAYSAIGDYDGFIITDPNEQGTQYQPNMGSTSAIAYCPSNPDVMVRYSNNDTTGYYSMDAGATWTKMAIKQNGQKAAITKLSDGTYRIFCGKAYSDDFGGTWNTTTGITCQSTPCITVDLKNPQYVYAAGNDNNGYDPTCKPNNYLYVSSDYGKTFTSKTICAYDKAEDYGRICSAGNGLVYTPSGYSGLYKTDNYGSSFTKFSNVDTCFAVGIGAAKVEGGPYTIYMWGKANGEGITGIYRSTDAGETWVRINDDDNQFGGPGNGRFIVGDMNTYGKVYMSTVGMGIVYGQLDTSPVTDVKGDVNGDGVVNQTDLLLVKKHILGITTLTSAQFKRADIDSNSKVSSIDYAMIKAIILSK